MATMDKLELIIENYNFHSEKFKEWQSFLTKEEQVVIILKQFYKYDINKICNEILYSESNVKRFLKSAKKKIKKILP